VSDLEGLTFNDNEMTVEYWSGDELFLPIVDVCIRGYDYMLSMEEAEKLRDFLNEALERGRGSRDG
jgi:hypothetical protein